MRAKAGLFLGLFLAVAARSAAQEPIPPLPVRKDALRPGWFFVGVIPGTPKDAPIVVEVRSGGESAPAKRFRSPDPRAFDLCSMLRSGGLAGTPATLYMNVTRGAGSFPFTIAYDGKRCAGEAAPPAPKAAQKTPPPAFEPLRLAVVAPPEETPPGEPAQTPPVTRVAEAAPPAPVTAREPVPPPAGAEPRPRPTEPAPEAVPGPTAVPVVAVAEARPAPAPEISLESSPRGGAEGLDAAARGLTKENFEEIRVLLERNKKLRTEDYRFVLKFRSPVNVDGIETAIILSATARLGKLQDFLDTGSEHLLDALETPRSTTIVSFTVPKAMAVVSPAVNQAVYLTLQLGDLAEARFKGVAGVKRQEGQ